jgi:hypothetical protein
MEERKSRIMTEEKLKNMIAKYSGLSSFKIDDCLEWDLGITGDDAIDLLNEYSITFSVDITKFSYNDYFHDEGQNILLMYRRLFKKKKKKRFTMENLLKGIENKKLN